MIDMTFKPGPSTINMYTTELHVCKQQHMPTANLKCLLHASLNILNTLVDMYMKLHKHLDFDGPICTHVFKYLQTMQFTCKQQQCTPIIHYKGEVLSYITGYP